MKTFIAILILTAGLAMTVPTASACSVFDDPTGTTLTCLDQYEDGYGDETCESFGGHSEGTTLTSGVPGVYSLYVDDSSYCFNGGFGGASRGSSTYASANVANTVFVSAGMFDSESDFGTSSSKDVSVGVAGVGGIGAGHSESESDFGSYCAFYVYVNEDAYQSIPC